MRILVDHSTIETFAQNGRTSVSLRVYPTRLSMEQHDCFVSTMQLKLVVGAFAAADLKSVDWSLVVKFWLRRINKCTIATMDRS
ncbi:beta-fructofuranosidase [Ranunculus cassubicifolius]